jgi:Outer membrane lipoprotein carrier protein LolA-like
MQRVLSFMALAICCAVGATPLRGAPADLRDLDQVMGMLALRQHGRVEFIEQQFLAVLSRPLESSGELRYDAPDRLEKRTLKPHTETLVLTGEVLTVERAHSRRVMDLHAYPQVLPFVESIRATLAGDRKALERLFRLDFAGSVSRWTLTLVPLESKVKQSVSQVRIDGAGDQLLKVEIRQPDGDRSLMTLRPSTLP